MADEDLDREKDDDTEVDRERESSASRPTLAARAARRRPLGELDTPPERGPAAYLAEFIGTFGLVFFICACAVLFIPGPEPAAQPGLPEVQPFQDWAVLGLVHAFALFVLIQAFAIASGAHFNPAVTVALAAIRQIRPIDAAIYVVVQVLGGLAAGGVVKLLLNNPNAGEGTAFGAPSVGQAAGGDVAVAMGAEVIGTFFLVLVIVGVAVNPRGLKDWSGWAIGATLGLGALAIGPLSGAGFNPARAFGPSVVGEFADVSALEWILIWVIGPVLGAVLAAFVYVQTIILPGRKGEEGLDPVG